jgi:hypothetical protein
MKRTNVFAIATALVLSAVLPLFALASPGTGAHFNSANDSIDPGNGALDASFTVAGLGNNPVTDTITMAISTAKAVYQCFNGGGNHPKAGNKDTVSTSLTTSGTFGPSDQHGSLGGSLTAGPPPPDPSFSCPSGQALFLQSVSYSGITLTDSYGATTSLPNQSAANFHLPL